MIRWCSDILNHNHSKGLKFLLSFLMAVGPTAQASSGMGNQEALRVMYEEMFSGSRKTYEFSRMDIFGSGLKGSQLFLTGIDNHGDPVRDHNRYSTATGIRVNPLNGDLIETKEFQRALKSTPVMLTQVDYVNSRDYKRLLTSPAGQKEVTRMLNQTSTSLSVAAGKNLFVEYKKDFDRAYLRAKQELAKNPSFKNIDFESRQKQVAIRQMEIFLKPHIETNGKRALQIIREDQRFLSSAKRRVEYNVKFGISTVSKAGIFHPKMFVSALRGQVMVDSKDLFTGKNVKVDLTPDPKQMKALSLPRAIDALKEGSLTSVKYHLPILAIMSLFNVAKLKMDYASNPNAVIDNLEMYTNPAFHLGMASFFIGGSATTWGSQMALNKSWMVLQSLTAKGGLYADRPIARRHKIGLTINSMSYTGLAGGVVFSSFVHKWGEKLWSCNQLLASHSREGDKFRSREDGSRTLGEARISTAKKQRLSDMCQKGWTDFIKEVMTDHNTWISVLSIMNARFIMTLATNFRSLKKTGKLPVVNLESAVGQAKNSGTKGLSRFKPGNLIIKSRGFAAPLVGGIVQIGAFVGIMVVTSVLLNKGYKHVTEVVPLKRYKRNAQDLADAFKQSSWAARSGLCKAPQYFRGKVVGSIKYLWNIITFNSEANSVCDEELINTYNQLHSEAEKSWRDGLLAPVTGVVNSWMSYTAQMTNMYLATKSFYKDLFEQIRLMKKKNPKLQFATKESKLRNEILKVSDPVLQSKYYDESLPLFRSSPFYGYSYRNGNDIEEKLSKPLSYHLGISWEERDKENHGKDLLMRRMAHFRSHIFPKITASLEEAKSIKAVAEQKLPGGKSQGEVLGQFIAYARSSKTIEHMTLVLERIRQYQDQETASNACGYEATQTLLAKCPFTYVQKQFLDKEVWTHDQDRKRYLHLGKVSGQFMGAKSSDKQRPFGVMPLAMGQEYLLGYNQRFENIGVDPYFIEKSEKRMRFVNMTEYLLKSTVCGVPLSEVEARGLLNNSMSYRWGVGKPKFSAPRFPLKSNIDVCAKAKDRIKQSTEGGDVWRHGWRDQAGFYNYIEDVDGKTGKSYPGVVALLFEELDTDKIGDFDQWWNKNIRPSFESVLDDQYEIYLHKVVNGKFPKILEKGYENTEDFKTPAKGVFQSQKAQVEFYFHHYLDPMVESLELDLSYVDFEDENQGRNQIMSEYRALKSDYFALFDYVIGQQTSLDSESLKAELDEIKDNIYEDRASQFKGIHADEMSQTAMRTQIVESLMLHKLLKIRRLFKADGRASVQAFFDGLIKLASEDGSITSKEREFRRAQLEEKRTEVLEAWENELDRSQRVLLDHSDYAVDAEGGEEYSPRVLILLEVFAHLENVSKEFSGIVEMRDRFENLKSLDARPM